MEFKCADEHSDKPVVSIKQDEEDVNIMVNDILVAWFDGDSGALCLTHPSDRQCRVLERCGIKLQNKKEERTLRVWETHRDDDVDVDVDEDEDED